MAKHYKKKLKKTIMQRIKNLMLIVFIILFIISIKKIIEWHVNNKKNKRIQEEISGSIVINKEKEYEIDFSVLKQKNPDTVGWLKVEGTEIEYVVVQAKDNNYYLTRNFEKEYNTSGWIFADYTNKIDGTDKNLVIYGHNVRDNSMFGTLKNILEEEWYNNEQNYKIKFITEKENAIYEVFSIYKIEAEDYYIQTEFETEASFEEFVKTIKKRSIKDFNKEITAEDKILTLSTCADNNKYRVVLHARKIEE